MTLKPEARVYAENEADNAKPEPCQWFALCSNPANGLRDGGPRGQVPICCSCDKKAAAL